MSRTIEVKNENFTEINLGAPLTPFYLLQNLDLSMNKIRIIETGFEECPNLQHLNLNDNLIREISASMFMKCKNLRTLSMEINQIEKVANLHYLGKLQELNLHNNKIEVMEGFTSLSQLRKLNLSFNKIRKIEGISSLLMLEVLELGRNLIESAD